MGYSLFCRALCRRHLSDGEVITFLSLQSFLRVYMPRSYSEIALRESPSPPFFTLLNARDAPGSTI